MKILFAQNFIQVENFLTKFSIEPDFLHNKEEPRKYFIIN